jgi:uncharacterized membrane protein YphA (DoxX/SURF4 family)
MGFLFKARGNISFGLLLIRLTLGIIFLISGAAKIVNLEAYISDIKAMDVMNENLSFIVGFFLPFVEIIFGSLFIIGLFTPLTSFVLSMLIVSYILFFGASAEQLPYSHYIVFLACTITTLFAGAGVISFDALLDKAKKNEKREITVDKTEALVVQEKPVQNENLEKVENLEKDEKIDVTVHDDNNDAKKNENPA